MSDVKWIKITTDIFDDEKILLIESLPEGDSIIVIWFKLLCLAGKQNNSGVFLINGKIPYTEKMLATIFRRKETTVKLALDTFEGFGMIEIENDIISIPKWGKHQNLEKMENRKEYMQRYMQEYRRKQKLIAQSSTLSNDNNGEDLADDNSENDVNSLRKCLHKHDVSTAEEDKNKNKNERKEKDQKPDSFASVFEEFFISDRLKAAIMDFIDYRESIGIPTNAGSLRALIKKLNELSSSEDEALAILEQSIANGWKGLFELKDKGKKPKTGGKGTGNFGIYEQRNFDYSDIEKKIRGYEE